jgi:hypothetical protein
MLGGHIQKLHVAILQILCGGDDVISIWHSCEPGAQRIAIRKIKSNDNKENAAKFYEK